jgi:predicted small metal-binding protein
MRVLDCDCGKTLQAANDDDLTSQVRDHIDESHPDMELTDDQVSQLVASRAYEASDS